LNQSGMKKRKQPENKGGSFSVKPFQELKGFQGAAMPPDAVRAAAKPSPPPPERDDDAELFERAVEGVRRLRSTDDPKSGKGEDIFAARLKEEEERRVFLREVEKIQLDVKFRDESPSSEPPTRPAPSNRLRELKKGAIHIGLELDLHGLTKTEALSSLERFIIGAYNRSQNAVLVITGKGNNSADEPVLLMAVQGWLRERGKGMVAEFAPAPRQLGGSGAFVVFLKKKPGV
jgi:DNA-nicking Smr family endonuclease